MGHARVRARGGRRPPRGDRGRARLPARRDLVERLSAAGRRPRLRRAHPGRALADAGRHPPSGPRRPARRPAARAAGGVDGRPPRHRAQRAARGRRHGAGELPARLRQRIESDLHRLGGAGLPSDDRAPADEDPWYDSELRRAIEDARDEGLAIDVSGEREAVALLAPDARRAVGLAVRQCLVNVLRHSGSATAEVAFSSGRTSVSVMVVDGGRGFAAAGAPGSDRLGLRQSVHDRISKVGGTVTVYSAEDVGTTVIMTLPVAEGA
ncbi:ATP-binding protein [Streptomyces sp. L7]|uniref:ATP-binding protein n=1 Tax=Streptomyces sp. L7 TaxID=3423954 RepID=UPI003D95C729